MLLCKYTLVNRGGIIVGGTMNRIIKDMLDIKSVRRTLNVFAILSIMVIAAPIANLTANAASANPNNPNDKRCFTQYNAKADVVYKNGYAVATFTVPKACKERQQVSLAVYKINDGIWQNRLNNQYLYASKTHWYAPGTHTITVVTPNCAWQADLVKGMPANLAATGQAQPHLAAKVGGDKVPCKATPKPTPKPTPTPEPTPTPTPDVPATTTETVEETPVSSETPTELANTGPGETAAVFAGISSIAGLGYNFFIRRRIGL